MQAVSLPTRSRLTVEERPNRTMVRLKGLEPSRSSIRRKWATVTLQPVSLYVGDEWGVAVLHGLVPIVNGIHEIPVAPPSFPPYLPVCLSSLLVVLRPVPPCHGASPHNRNEPLRSSGAIGHQTVEKLVVRSFLTKNGWLSCLAITSPQTMHVNLSVWFGVAHHPFMPPSASTLSEKHR
jgi:hypothetical protein